MKKNLLLDIQIHENPQIKQKLINMKHIAFSFFLFMFCLLSQNTNAQNARVTIAVKNGTIEEVLNLIEKQTSYLFIYDTRVNVSNRVSVKAEKTPVSKVLNTILKKNNMHYTMEGNHIILYENTRRNTNHFINAPKGNVTKQKLSGKITDASGEPLIGASVKVKGSNTGTITDLNGVYSLEVDGDDVVEASYIGYQVKQISVGNRNTVNITLKEDSKSLDEVVVVGFGTQKKINLTGSVGVATAADIKDRPVTNAVQALQGVVPGLNITTQGFGGELNSTKAIDVRGLGTIGSGSSGSPLILIDGTEGDINTLNPQDIENISVLKDAAASSIYGSRAPFGVILVTTKKGKPGRAQVNFNMNMRYSTQTKLPKMASSYEFVNLYDDAQYNGTGTHLYTDEYKQAIYDYMVGKSDKFVMDGGSGGKWNYDFTMANVDWLREYYKKWSPSQEYNVSVSGGSDKITYYVSANYLNQEGFMRYGTDKYKRYTTTAKISAQLLKNLRLDYSNRFVRTDYSKPSYMNWDFYQDVLRRSRATIPKYNPDGYPMADSNYIEALSDGGRTKDQNDGFLQQFRVTFTPIKNWNIIGELNFRIDNNWEHWDKFIYYAHYKDNPQNTYIAFGSSTQNIASEYSYRSTYLNPTVY